MATVSTQKYQSIFSELEYLKEKFLALEQENQQLLGDLQQISLGKHQMQQQHGELVLRMKQLEETIVEMQQKRPVRQGFIKNLRSAFP